MMAYIPCRQSKTGYHGDPHLYDLQEHHSTEYKKFILLYMYLLTVNTITCSLYCGMVNVDTIFKSDKCDGNSICSYFSFCRFILSDILL